MAIGNNDFDNIDDFEDYNQPIAGDDIKNTGDDFSDDINPDKSQDTSTSPEDDFISSLLKSRGIEDSSKIKFEGDEGNVEEVDWNNLSTEDKMNVLKSTESNPETDLDDYEIQLINTIRDSKMSPSEWVQYMAQESVNRYIQNSQQEKQYSIDQYNDDELFVADFISRYGDVTEEQAKEALELAKSNKDLYEKLIGAIRNEYKVIEDEKAQQQLMELEQHELEEFNKFSESVADEIRNFTEFSGYDLNLNRDEMQAMYDFITGTDAAGNNHFVKMLSDPKNIVPTAWFALNGEKMINDITDYFLKEIAQVRKSSYEKGIADAKNKKDNSVLTFKNKRTGSKSTFDDDLDNY